MFRRALLGSVFSLLSLMLHACLYSCARLDELLALALCLSVRTTFFVLVRSILCAVSYLYIGWLKPFQSRSVKYKLENPLPSMMG